MEEIRSQMREIASAIESLQVQVPAISNEILGNNSLLINKNDLRTQLDECSKKMDAFQDPKSWILGQVSEHDKEEEEM